MATAAPILRNELRRHLFINGCLVASCIIGGTVVTNERGLFVPIGIHGISATARAFAAMFSPSDLSSARLRGMKMVSPFDQLAPLQVTGDPNDLRRRLMEAVGFDPNQAANFNRELDQLAGDTISPTEVAQNDPSAAATPAGSGSGTGGDPTAGTPFGGGTGDTLPGAPFGSGPESTNQTTGGTTTNPTNPGTDTTGGTDTDSAVPEPSVWAMLIVGFGMMGFVQRTFAARRRTVVAKAG